MSDGLDDTVGGRANPSTAQPVTGWISLKQMAVLLEKDYRTIRRWCAEKRILTVKVGGHYRIYRDEVHYILRNGTREPVKSGETEEPS